MRFVEHVDPQPQVRTWRRKRAVVVASCWLGGLAALYATLLFAIAAAPRFVYLGLVPSVAFFIAARWVRIGKRRAVLYLRRFRNPDRSLRSAIAWSVDRRYPVVTLDDGMMTPARIPMVDLGSALFTGTLWGGLAGLSVGLALFGFTSSEPPELQVWNVVVTAVAVVPGLALGFGVGLIRAIAVQWRTRVRVRLEEDLTKVETALRRLRGGGMAPSYLVPRLVVVSTVDAWWQAAVKLAADRTACTVIDVSEPSENLLWEVDQALSLKARPTLFTANAEAIRQWCEHTATGASAEAAGLAQRLEGHDVLVYQSEGVFGTRRLGHSLTAALDNALLNSRARILGEDPRRAV